MQQRNENQNSPGDELDRLLDATLKQYAAVQPREGLETRILARVRSHRRRTRQLRVVAVAHGRSCRRRFGGNYHYGIATTCKTAARGCATSFPNAAAWECGCQCAGEAGDETAEATLARC